MNSKKRQCPEWVVVASHEFMKMIHHLELRSIYNASKELHINYRTLRKLDESNPDASLSIEKLMEIWHSLEVFATLVQSPERAGEESRIIADSLMCIVRTFSVNKLLNVVVGNTGSSLDGDVPYAR